MCRHLHNKDHPSCTYDHPQCCCSAGILCQHLCTNTPHFIIPSAAALQAFFADIYAEARKAKPGLGHRALAQVAGAHKLLRHYTMNIDGLAEAAGMDTWHVDNNPAGQSQLLYLPFSAHAGGFLPSFSPMFETTLAWG